MIDFSLFVDLINIKPLQQVKDNIQYLLYINSMLNSYTNESKANDKNQLRILDYRNGKYQGTTLGLNMTRDGIGMVMDHNYLLAMASWRGGVAEGEVLIIFPDNTLFYGSLKNKFPWGIGCYQVSGKLQIYSLIGRGSDDLFVLDDNHNRNLILLAVAPQIMQKLYSQPTADENFLRPQDGQNKQKTKVSLRSETSYKSKDEKWVIIEDFFKTVYKNEMKSYKDFVKHYFGNEAQAASARIQVNQTKQEVQFNFVNSSITCKISHNNDNQLDFRVKAIGYYNQNERRFETCKKSYKNDLIQETVNDSKIEYPLNKRPISCIKQTQQYYKKSLHFVNNFIQIDYLYRVKFIYHSIETSVGQISINKNAQKLLQNINQIKDYRHEKSKSKEHSQNDPYSIENLNKAKEDIYKAIKNKSQSRTKSISNSHIQYYPESISISRATNINNKTNKLKQQTNYRVKVNDKNYLQNASNTSPGKRSYVYLEEDQNARRKKTNNSPAKYNYVGDALNNGRAQSKSNGKLTKYKYLQKDEKKQGVRIENLTALTSYYEQIESQLRKEATPKRSDRKFKNTDGFTNRRSTYTYNLKEGQRGQARTPEKKQSSQPFGTRKIYKYG